MSYYCVAAGCTNVPDAKRNISLQPISQDDDNRTFEKKTLHQIRSYKTLRLEIAWTVSSCVKFKGFAIKCQKVIRPDNV